MRLWISIAMLPALCSGAATAPSTALEDIMAMPFSSSMLASPNGSRVAWVVNERGERNLYVAEAPDWKGHRLTAFADDGQEIGSLTWNAAGDALYFVRGDDWTGAEIVNPDWQPLTPDRSIWRAAVDGSAAARVVEGRDPAVSIHGDLAFLRDGRLYLLPADAGSGASAASGAGAGAGAGEARLIVRSRGSIKQLRWSPSGEAIAFVDGRGDHSFIGVYEPPSQRLRYLDASVDSDSDPAWSPDGKHLAYLRTPAGAAWSYYLPSLEDEPFSIRVAEVASGKAREAWRADAGEGSVLRKTALGDQLMWAASGRLVFAWERGGWLRLYAVDADGGGASGGGAKLLTPGEHEVEDVALSPDARTIYFSSNRDDPDRRHLWQVGVDGQAVPRRVTQGQGIEANPAPLAGNGAVAYLASDARRPMRAMVRQAGKVTEPLPAGDVAANRHFVEPSSVRFTATDGASIPAQLFLPRGTGRRPAIVFIHGGPPRQTLLGYHNRYYYSNAYALNQYLVSQGYVVLSVNYRRSIGYGLRFREAPDNGITGASEFRDILGAGLFLRSRDDVDPLRIGLWGGSYGGYLVALGLARASELFAAGVDFHGVHDWSISSPDYFPAYDPRQLFLPQAQMAFESSPLASIGTWRSPVLLIHGDDDRNVPFSETVNLVRALRKQGVPHEQLVFPNEAHDFLLYRHWVESYAATADFLGRKLALAGRRP